MIEQMGLQHHAVTDCARATFAPGQNDPGDCELSESSSGQTSQVRFFHGHDIAGPIAYADVAEQAVPFIVERFGPLQKKAATADLSDQAQSHSNSGAFLLTPLCERRSQNRRTCRRPSTHFSHGVHLSRDRGSAKALAHFAQALCREHQSGRQAALDYAWHSHRSALSAAEKEKPRDRAQIRTIDQSALWSTRPTKNFTTARQCACGGCCANGWLTTQALKKALASYRPEQDKEPAYMQRLIQAQTQRRDLEWFFDDWVYRDRGLPDFKVASAFVRKTLPEATSLPSPWIT